MAGCGATVSISRWCCAITSKTVAEEGKQWVTVTRFYELWYVQVCC
jgi:hypothetical protein